MQLLPSIALVASGEMRLTDRYDCNCYLIDGEEGPILLDSGCGRDTDRILERCRRSFGPPAAVLLTHAHADHSQGAPALQDRDIPIIAPAPSAPLLRSGTDTELGLDAAKRDEAYPSEYTFTHFAPDRLAEPGSELTAAGRTFEVVSVRGHSADHVCYLAELDGRRACFVGDAVAADGRISLLNVPGSSLADYREELGNLSGRGVDALLPGHGLPKLEDGQAAIDTAVTALQGMFSPPSRT